MPLVELIPVTIGDDAATVVCLCRLRSHLLPNEVELVVMMGTSKVIIFQGSKALITTSIEACSRSVFMT